MALKGTELGTGRRKSEGAVVDRRGAPAPEHRWEVLGWAGRCLVQQKARLAT